MNLIVEKDLLQHYKKFFDLSPDLFCISGYDGYFKKVNASVSQLLGYSLTELYTNPINKFVHPDDRKITSVAGNSLLKNHVLHNFENRYVTKNGNIVWLSWTSFPCNEDQMVFGVAKNITHKKILEKERNELMDEIAKMNNDLKLINYTTSHDLRSPVNNMLAIFSCLDKSKINDEETNELLEILKLASESLHTKLNNYIDKVSEQKKLAARIEKINISDCLNSVLHSIQALVSGSGSAVFLDLGAKEIMYDKGYLESIFLNLITNSIKYARPQFAPQIYISTIQTSQGILLTVKDNGLGFDMQKVQGRLFGMNQKFHNHTDSKGIGLYLVHRYVTSLGGTIAADSTVNNGTTFTLLLKHDVS